jgi:integrase/recombinase XerD
VNPAIMNPTVNSFLQMMSVERGSSSNTLNAYARDLGDLFEFLIQRNMTMEDMSSDTLQEYISELVKKGLSQKTVARRMSTLRQFFGFMYAEGHRDDNPVTRLESPRQPRSLPNVLTEQEVLKLIDTAAIENTAHSKRLSCLLELVYSSGLRVTELVSLPMAAIRPNQPFVIVMGKGRKERLVPLSPPARQAIEIYMKYRYRFVPEGDTNNIFLFPSRGREGHLTRMRFFQLLRGLAEESGIPSHKVNPHALRHSFATHLLSRGADLRVIQEMLGHADISTTEIYTHVVQEQIQALIETHHPLVRRRLDKENPKSLDDVPEQISQPAPVLETEDA